MQAMVFCVVRSSSSTWKADCPSAPRPLLSITALQPPRGFPLLLAACKVHSYNTVWDICAAAFAVGDSEWVSDDPLSPPPGRHVSGFSFPSLPVPILSVPRRLEATSHSTVSRQARPFVSFFFYSSSFAGADWEMA